MKQAFIIALLLISCFVTMQPAAQATEGASSYYFPGSSTTFAVAVAPKPGYMVANQMLIYSGTAEKAVLGGREKINLKASAIYNYMGGSYTFKKPVLGGKKLQLGAYIPVGYMDLEAKIASHGGDRNSRTRIGDAMVSAALFWQQGDLHYKLNQTIMVPTGSYSKDQLANVGRNYWGFDTSLSLTWLNLKKGWEISVTPGVMLNTRNSATDYKSGNEFHVDFAINKHYFAKHYAVGLHGYYYHQVSGDSGEGAILGAFKGESFGIGPAILWTPKVAKGEVVVMAKWLHDFHNSNRLQGNYGVLTVAYKY